MKRTKAYSPFNEVRPTIRNKPSGLVNNWPQVLAKTSAATHHWPSTLTPLTPSSSLSATPPPSSSLSATPPSSTCYWQPQPSPIMPNVDSFDPAMSAPDTVTPFLGQQSLSFHFNSQNHQSVHSFPRRSKDSETGKVQLPGLKDLPHSIQSNFCNTFIRHIMKLVFSDTSPWGNPSLSVSQHEFNLIYSPLQYRLHADDAVVIPVTILTKIPNISALTSRALPTDQP